MRSKGEHWRLSREIDRPSWASFEPKSYSLSSVPNKSELQAGRHTVSWGMLVTSVQMQVRHQVSGPSKSSTNIALEHERRQAMAGELQVSAPLYSKSQHMLLARCEGVRD